MPETIRAKYDPATTETKAAAQSVFLKFTLKNQGQWVDRYKAWSEAAGFAEVPWMELPDFALKALVIAVQKTLPGLECLTVDVARVDVPPSTKTKAKSRKRSAKDAANTTPAPQQNLEVGSWE